MSKLELAFHRGAIHAILLCDLLFTSRIYRVIDHPSVQPAVLGLCAALVISYSLASLFRGNALPVLIALGAVLLIVNQLEVFSIVSGQPVLVNAGFQYILPLTFIAFYYVATCGLREYLVNTLFAYAFAYTAFYFAMAVLYQLHILPPILLEPLVLTDIERGERLFNYTGASTFAWFVFLSRVRTSFSVQNGVGALIAGAAIVLSLSRVFILVIAIISIFEMLNFKTLTIRRICLSVLYLATLTYLYGFLDPKWNPFDIFSSDSSGGARAEEYDVARLLLHSNWLYGVGIPPTTVDLGYVTGNEFFAASDLGTLGIWFDWGLVGFVLFFVGCHIITREALGARQFRRALFLTGAFIVAYSVLAPLPFYPSGAIYFASLLGMWLSRPGAQILTKPRGPADLGRAHN
ncbi:O-antigen ligase family protein [Bradyrhizobium liaoningense]|uniref:O-antigen ligase family protein n=1 Tax=Bradyrhizobium liaoningense TaxID=43992 RepID=UPI001BA75825|nr:O-antigen ligase family protein [Bradyrhizobium liaoningense]MBR0737660.1 O-antigen ligase family protein [Bradyrhizobium liaoningense]